MSWPLIFPAKSANLCGFLSALGVRGVDLTHPGRLFTILSMPAWSRMIAEKAVAIPFGALAALALLLSMLLPGCVSDDHHHSVPPRMWLQVQPGMSKEQVHQLVADPQLVDAVHSRETWIGKNRWKLVVTFGADGTVISVEDHQSIQ
jgi:hypothetical protein